MQHYLLLLSYTIIYPIVFVFNFIFFVPTLATPQSYQEFYDNPPQKNDQYNGMAFSTERRGQRVATPMRYEAQNNGYAQYHNAAARPQSSHYQGEQSGGLPRYYYNEAPQYGQSDYQNYGQISSTNVPYNRYYEHQPQQQQIPDLLSSDDYVTVQQQQSLNSSVPLSSSLVKVNSLMDQMSIGPNMKGTMEIYYTETELKWTDSDGKEKLIQIEIYRQRDNSGHFIKFRHINKQTNRTLFSCVAPMPKDSKRELKLYFNNNTKVQYTFDATGYMIVPENRMYNQEKFEQFIGNSIQSILKEKRPIMLPAQPSANVAPVVDYPSFFVQQWVGLPLPVHPSLAKPSKNKIGFMNTDASGKSALDQLMDDRSDKIMEQMDDGGNWIKIEVKQLQRDKEKAMPMGPKNYSSATFVRDLRGQPPNTGQPMVLFFNGRRQYFDKEGMAISHFAVIAMNRWEEKAKQWANNPALDAFLAANRKAAQEEEADKHRQHQQQHQQQQQQQQQQQHQQQQQQQANGTANGLHQQAMGANAGGMAEHPQYANGHQQTAYVGNPGGIAFEQPQYSRQPSNGQLRAGRHRINPTNQHWNARMQRGYIPQPLQQQTLNTQQWHQGEVRQTRPDNGQPPAYY